MKPVKKFYILIILLVSANTCLAETTPANTLKEFNAQLNACLKIPRAPEGGDMTILLSIKRDGSLYGKPRVVFAKQLIAPQDQADFMGSVIYAIKNCFPLKITDTLGAAIAGRPFRFRVTQQARETEI